MPAFSTADNQLLAQDTAANDVIGIDDVSAGLSKGMVAGEVANLAEYIGSAVTDVAGASQAAIIYRPIARNTSGTPANGIGYGFQFSVQTGVSTAKVAAGWRVHCTDVTSGSEDFKHVFELMIAGAAKVDIAEIDNVGLNLITGKVVRVNQVQVLGPRVTGFVTSAGTAAKDASAFNVDSFTATDANIRLLGKWVKAIHDALITHGAIGA